MKTEEILTSFLKGGERSQISDKQKYWLLSQAKREGIVIEDHQYNQSIYIGNVIYAIRQCQVLASGGSYVGKRFVQGRYIIEKKYHIKFCSTGYTTVCINTDIEHYKREGHAFTFITTI